MTPLFRVATVDDLDAIWSLAQEAGPGITSLTSTKEQMHQRMLDTTTSFVFVLEIDGVVVGTSAILSRIATQHPFFAYHRHLIEKKSVTLKTTRTIEELHFIRARKKPTEIGSLLLNKAYRKKNVGRLLSLARFLFIACFPQNFATMVVAELRGFIDKDGNSPFWDNLGFHFFQLPFKEADRLRAQHPECIEDFFPVHPIYPILLPKAAQEAIGKTHPNTTGALKILKEQNFRLSDYIDLFDGGPHLYAPTEQIKTIQESCVATSVQIQQTIQDGKNALLSNTERAFRATYAPIQVDENKRVIMEEKTAKILEVEPNEPLRYCLV